MRKFSLLTPAPQPPKAPTNFRVGETAIFKEEGVTLKVKILENPSDELCEKYRLRVLMVLKSPSPRLDCQKKGAEINVSRHRDNLDTPIWKLEKMPPKS